MFTGQWRPGRWGGIHTATQPSRRQWHCALKAKTLVFGLEALCHAQQLSHPLLQCRAHHAGLLKQL